MNDTNKDENTQESINSTDFDNQELENIDNMASKIEAQEAEILELKKQLEETEDAKLRALADLQNYQRREAENKKNWSQYAVANFIKKSLPSFLELQLAADHSESEDLQKIVDKFFENLAKQGLKKVSTQIGDEINPEIHEVLMSAEGEAGKVVQIFEAGWQLNDQIIMPAKISGGIQN